MVNHSSGLAEQLKQFHSKKNAAIVPINTLKVVQFLCASKYDVVFTTIIIYTIHEVQLLLIMLRQVEGALRALCPI